MGFKKPAFESDLAVTNLEEQLFHIYQEVHTVIASHI